MQKCLVLLTVLLPVEVFFPNLRQFGRPPSPVALSGARPQDLFCPDPERPFLPISNFFPAFLSSRDLGSE